LNNNTKINLEYNNYIEEVDYSMDDEDRYIEDVDYDSDSFQPPRFDFDGDPPLNDSERIKFKFEFDHFFWLMGNLHRLPSYNKVSSLFTLCETVVVKHHLYSLSCSCIVCERVNKIPRAIVILQRFYRRYIHPELLSKYECIYEVFKYLYT
jgi:hypothetical protein